MEEDKPQTDPSVIEEVKRITSKEISAVTADEAAFLRARKHYLGRNSRAKFADVLNAKPEEAKKEDPQKPAKEENKKEDKKGEPAKEEKKTSKPEVDDASANGQPDTDDDEDDGDIEEEDSEKV